MIRLTIFASLSDEMAESWLRELGVKILESRLGQMWSFEAEMSDAVFKELEPFWGRFYWSKHV